MLPMVIQGKCEALWTIFRISHPRSRYIYDLFYRRRKDISKELYEFCLGQDYADRNLITKWKKASFRSNVLQGIDSVYRIQVLGRNID
ncbi:hypothetical protein CFC21_043368 [Triticum aestivum]|uniref:Protein FAR1-RELATED SEQUENCE n=2 Tax=Triticum aestivum TaxID=4565 RepID=A0A9R1FNV8_WHEAT|nr:hypothetical protein CFC21_043368 [Triticum aestivum]